LKRIIPKIKVIILMKLVEIIIRILEKKNRGLYNNIPEEIIIRILEKKNRGLYKNIPEEIIIRILEKE